MSIKPTQLFIESPENLIPLEEKSLNLETLYSLFNTIRIFIKEYQLNKTENILYSVPFMK